MLLKGRNIAIRYHNYGHYSMGFLVIHFSALFHKVEQSPVNFFHPPSPELRSCLGKLCGFEPWNINMEFLAVLYYLAFFDQLVQVKKCK